jgi:hypothetical protein
MTTRKTKAGATTKADPWGMTTRKATALGTAHGLSLAL